jgi:hypothetical protein
MFRHRLAPEADYYRLPEPPPPTVQPGSFLLCSVAVLPGCTLGQWAGLQQVYVYAFGQAQAAARPSLLERDVFAFWN